MPVFRRFIALFLLILLALPTTALAQTSEDLEDILEDVHDLIKDALADIADALHDADLEFNNIRWTLHWDTDEFDDIREDTHDWVRDLRSALREAAREDRHFSSSERRQLERKLDRLFDRIDREVDRAYDRRDRARDRARTRGDRRWNYDWDDDDDWGLDWNWNRDWDFPYPHNGYLNTGLWPFAEEGIYRGLPALRYNRVDGLVLGIGVQPKDWFSTQRFKMYGQLGYAFASKKGQVHVGLESKGWRRGDRFSAFKWGGAFYRQTFSDETWKINSGENSLAAFFFKEDYLNYFQVYGWTVYLGHQVSRTAQITVGYRVDEHTSLETNTNWALFGGDAFPFNPAINEGDMKSVVVALEAGRVRGLFDTPEGDALRLEAEIGDGLGGDFSFNRYLGEGRLYIPIGGFDSLILRARGGYLTGNGPLQKTFRIGGIGTVRGYPQNAYVGTRMGLMSAEYVFGDTDIIWSDVQLFVFTDAGWVGNTNTDFDTDDLLISAGGGLSFADRRIRLEVAIPLGNQVANKPALWFRFAPTF